MAKINACASSSSSLSWDCLWALIASRGFGSLAAALVETDESTMVSCYPSSLARSVGACHAFSLGLSAWQLGSPTLDAVTSLCARQFALLKEMNVLPTVRNQVLGCMLSVVNNSLFNKILVTK